MNRKNTIEKQLRTLFQEDEFADVNPPEDFLQNVMQQLPKRTSEPVSFFSKCGQLGQRLWNTLTRPMTISVSPMQVAASLAVVLYSVSFVYDLPKGKENKMVKAVPLASEVGHLKPVSFALYDPDRNFTSAVVIGSFNKWQSRGFEMSYDKVQEAWVLEHELPPGEYEYVFLVNGEAPMPDPRAVFYVQDSFGNKNSLLQVGGVQHEL